jgi:hypothetical protein
MPFAETTPLLITLTADHEGLIAGLVYELPQSFACYLIANRKAIPVADMNAFADVSLSEAELDELSLIAA